MKNSQVTAALKHTADYAFMQGFSKTHFMREVHQHPDCKVELNNPVSDCYYHESEPELLALIEQLGYTILPFGFCKA